MSANTAAWPQVKLGRLGDALIGLTYTPEDVGRFGTLVLRSSNIQDGRLAFDTNVYVTCPIPDRIRVHSKDILICVRNGSRRLIGKSTILDDRVAGQTFGAFMAVFRSPANDYLAYYFQSDNFKRQVDEHLGATINQITNASLKSFEVALPESAERAEIIARLDDADALVVSLERLLHKKRDLRLGMMQELLSGRLRLSGYSDPWRRVLLGNHVSYLKTVALSRAQLDDRSPLRYIHYGDIHTSSDVTLAADQANMPRADAALAGNATRLRVGDLIFADASEDPAGVGRSIEVTSVPADGVVSGLHTIAARFDKDVLADGFKAYLQFMPEFRKALVRLVAGTKVLATTRSYISSIELVVPNADEQRAISDVLNDAELDIKATERRLGKAKNLKQGIMQELLSGRTRLIPAQVTAQAEVVSA